jgi:hypothetical protein
MKRHGLWRAPVTLVLATALGGHSAIIRKAVPCSGVPTQMVVTVEARQDISRPSVNRQDLIVYEGSDRVPVISWTALQGETASLELLLLIESDGSSELNSQTDDLNTFINTQPITTAIAVGQMCQNRVDIVRRFTTNHSLVVEALQQLHGSTTSYPAAYPSLMDLMDHWSPSATRREILMIVNAKGLDSLTDSNTQSIITIA